MSGTAWTEFQKIYPADEVTTAGGAGFGAAVAISGDGNYMIIGGAQDAEAGSKGGTLNSGFGAAWIYNTSGGTWIEQQKILSPVPGAAGGTLQDFEFGFAVDIDYDGDTAIIGAPNWAKNIGVGGSYYGGAFVYARSGTSWSVQGTFVGIDTVVGRPRVGQDVSIADDGDTVLVGSQHAASTDPGLAWVFDRSGTTWTQTAQLSPPSFGASNVRFGNSVDISSDGTWAAIGAPGDRRVWLYENTGSWSVSTAFIPGTAPAGSSGPPGTDVAINSNGVVLATGNSNGTLTGPSAHVLEYDGALWNQTDITVSGGTQLAGGNNYRVCVSPDANYLIISDPLYNSLSGYAWIYKRDSLGVWTLQEAGWFPADESGAAQFGVDASLNDSAALIGGATDTAGGTASWGAAWVYSAPAAVVAALREIWGAIAL